MPALPNPLKLKAKFQKDHLSEEVLEKSINVAEKLFPGESLPASAAKVIELIKSDKKYRKDGSPIDIQDFNNIQNFTMLKLSKAAQF